MKKITEFWFEELGYFCEADCRAIKEKVSGTFYNINVIYSNCCGNYSIGFTTDYDYEAYGISFEEFEKDARNMFLHIALCALRK